ncbi:hypothetical protein ANO11243_091860 [Dothideomycetidae sp. 11243]|nr:hypothetical protein ANO11243_091860 [fungal sp. No.11243]
MPGTQVELVNFSQPSEGLWRAVSISVAAAADSTSGSVDAGLLCIKQAARIEKVSRSSRIDDGQVSRAALVEAALIGLGPDRCDPVGGPSRAVAGRPGRLWNAQGLDCGRATRLGDGVAQGLRGHGPPHQYGRNVASKINAMYDAAGRGCIAEAHLRRDM